MDTITLLFIVCAILLWFVLLAFIMGKKERGNEERHTARHSPEIAGRKEYNWANYNIPYTSLSASPSPSPAPDDEEIAVLRGVSATSSIAKFSSPYGKQAAEMTTQEALQLSKMFFRDSKCAYCGRKIDAQEEYCSHCGAPNG
jgi:hypothetical protein